MFPLRSENALLNRIGRTRTRRRNVIFTIITNSLSFIFRCFFDYLSSAFPMMHRRCGRLMVQSQPHSSPPCVHNFSANIFAFSSFLFFRKLSQIIISNFWGAFRCFHRIATLSMFHSLHIVQLSLLILMIIIPKFVMMQGDSFSGLCNQNSMVYNAWIVMRLFYHRFVCSFRDLHELFRRRKTFFFSLSFWNYVSASISAVPCSCLEG